MFLTIWRELPYYQEFDVLYCFQYARTEGFYLIFLLFAAIPYTRAFVHDFQNKSYRLLLVRARSTLTYSISKVMSCFLSSGTAIIVSQLLFIFTLRLFCPLVDTQGATYSNLADSLLFGAAFKWSLFSLFHVYYCFKGCRRCLFKRCCSGVFYLYQQWLYHSNDPDYRLLSAH